MKEKKTGYFLSLRWLYPAHCALCDGILERKEEGLCEACRKRVRIAECPFEGGYAAFPYTGIYRDAVRRFKYSGRAEYAAWFAEAVLEAGRGLADTWQPEALVPVPIHRNRFRERGYNQAEELARELGKRLHVPCEAEMVTRCRDTLPQNGLDPAGRKENLQGAFAVRDKAAVPARVVLVDDIRTTGSTLRELEKVLRKSGAEEVRAMCICLAGNGI